MALCQLLAQRNIANWVMGGWGVDALLGRQTRNHHDLDLLVSFDDLGALQDLLFEQGFSRKLIWDDENRWVDVRGVQSPTAFVEADGRGRELDVHVIQLVPGGAPIPLCDVPWSFDEHSLLNGVGTIAGAPVRCVSTETQLQMHAGYELPPNHQQDVERLRELLGDGPPRRHS